MRQRMPYPWRREYEDELPRGDDAEEAHFTAREKKVVDAAERMLFSFYEERVETDPAQKTADERVAGHMKTNLEKQEYQTTSKKAREIKAAELARRPDKGAPWLGPGGSDDQEWES